MLALLAALSGDLVLHTEDQRVPGGAGVASLACWLASFAAKLYALRGPWPPSSRWPSASRRSRPRPPVIPRFFPSSTARA